MIFPTDCYFYCDTEAEVEELLKMLDQDGMHWASMDRLPEKLLLRVGRTYYRIRHPGVVTYGGKVSTESDWPEYSIDDARRFYTGVTSSCEVPSIDDLL